VYFLSYGWQGDNTIYDVKVVTATFDDIATEAAGLAAEGFIITALGGNFTDGFILVGTRVQGDALPRPLVVAPYGQQKDLLWNNGYATVGYLVSADASNKFWIGEK
jgi:hypothetical protein